MKKYILLLGIIGLLTGCNEKVYEASFYQSNPDQAKEVLKKCQSGDMTGKNCGNASKGYDAYKAQAFKDYMLGKTKEKPNFD
ncbi:hypothetical protein SAMN04487787_12814 [Kosakonia sacchari]|nr:hypothetical protein SAMN04487787_12814 [Kosakonia sacchari]